MNLGPATIKWFLLSSKMTALEDDLQCVWAQKVFTSTGQAISNL
jgi:hypothetical protein